VQARYKDLPRPPFSALSFLPLTKCFCNSSSVQSTFAIETIISNFAQSPTITQSLHIYSHYFHSRFTFPRVPRLTFPRVSRFGLWSSRCRPPAIPIRIPPPLAARRPAPLPFLSFPLAQWPIRSFSLAFAAVRSLPPPPASSPTPSSVSPLPSPRRLFNALLTTGQHGL
jgi:hypothetical protein